MLKFADRLRLDEVEKFIASNGFLVHGLTLARTPRDNIKGTFNVASYDFDFIFDDNIFILKAILYNSSVIKKFEEYEADISNEDWHCFMKECFGDEYVCAYFNNLRLPYDMSEEMNDFFLSRITLEDVCDLIGEKLVSISCIKEVEAFDITKRRFKFYTGTETREVTISSFYDHSSLRKYISEEQFLEFMFKKFGKEFADYYVSIIDSIENSIANSVEQSKSVSDEICVYRENTESLKCKRYLAERIFSK